MFEIIQKILGEKLRSYVRNEYGGTHANLKAIFQDEDVEEDRVLSWVLRIRAGYHYRLLKTRLITERALEVSCIENFTIDKRQKGRTYYGYRKSLNSPCLFTVAKEEEYEMIERYMISVMDGWCEPGEFAPYVFEQK